MRGTRGTVTTTFWIGVPYLHFLEHRWRICSQRGDLRRLNYTKTVFDQGCAADPTMGAHDVPPYPIVGYGGLPRLPPSELVPPLFRRTLRLCPGQWPLHDRTYPRPWHHCGETESECSRIWVTRRAWSFRHRCYPAAAVEHAGTASPNRWVEDGTCLRDHAQSTT